MKWFCVLDLCQTSDQRDTSSCASTRLSSVLTQSQSSPACTHLVSWSGGLYSRKPTWLWRPGFLMVSCPIKKKLTNQTCLFWLGFFQVNFKLISIELKSLFIQQLIEIHWLILFLGHKMIGHVESWTNAELFARHLLNIR